MRDLQRQDTVTCHMYIQVYKYQVIVYCAFINSTVSNITLYMVGISNIAKDHLSFLTHAQFPQKLHMKTLVMACTFCSRSRCCSALRRLWISSQKMTNHSNFIYFSVVVRTYIALTIASISLCCISASVTCPIVYYWSSKSLKSKFKPFSQVNKDDECIDRQTLGGNVRTDYRPTSIYQGQAVGFIISVPIYGPVVFISPGLNPRKL